MLLLTGGAGFVGSNILKGLNAAGRDDILIVDSLKNSAKYKNLIGARFWDFIERDQFYERLDAGKWDGEPIDAICHQGACTDTLEYDGDFMMRRNYEASKSILHLALTKKIPLVYASSAAVYGQVGEAVESAGQETPLNIYGYSKLIFDRYVQRVAVNAESMVVGLRYFNVYGPGEQHKGRMASMAYQLAEQIKATRVAKLFGAVGPYAPGEQTRDFVWVDDLVDMNLFFFDRAPVTAIVNAGSGVRSTWNQLAEAVIDSLGDGTVEYIPFPDALKDKYQFNTRADLSVLRSLGYAREMTPLKIGIQNYLAG